MRTPIPRYVVDGESWHVLAAAESYAQDQANAQDLPVQVHSVQPGEPRRLVSVMQPDDDPQADDFVAPGCTVTLLQPWL